MNNIQQVLAIYWKLCDRNPQNRWFTLIIIFFSESLRNVQSITFFFTTRTSFCAWDHYPPVLGGVGWGKGDRCSGFPPPDRETRAGAHRRCRGRGRGDRGTTPRMRVGWRCRGGRPIGGCTPQRSWAAATGGCPGLWRARGCAQGRPPRSRNGRLFPSRQPCGTACCGQTRGRWWCAFGRWRAEGHRRGPWRRHGGLRRRARPGWSGRQLPAGHRATGGAPAPVLIIIYLPTPDPWSIIGTPRSIHWFLILFPIHLYIPYKTAIIHTIRPPPQ